MAKKAKFYVVWRGETPGIYSSWNECKKNIDGYAGAKYKSFSSLKEAEAAYADPNYVFEGGKKKKTPTSYQDIAGVNWESISVDAACSGNPGKMEYQGVHTKTREVLFKKKFELGTNNIGEFLAIVHGLAYLKQRNIVMPIYTDSKIALSWVRYRKAKSKLERNHKTEELYQVIERAENWLKANTYSCPLIKWDTKSWGEIPADFGRK